MLSTLHYHTPTCFEPRLLVGKLNMQRRQLGAVAMSLTFFDA